MAGWSALAILVLAPWPYAGVPEWTRPLLTSALLAVTSIWLLGLAWARRKPEVPRLLGWTLLYLAIHGALLVANAQTWYDRENFTFLPARPWWEGWWAPGALDTVDTKPLLLQMGGVTGLLCLLVDLASEARWRWRIFVAMLGSVLLQCLYGLVQRWGDDFAGLWSARDLARPVFGSFYYHGNSAAYVNLALPGAVAVALWGWRDFATPWRALAGWALVGVLFLAQAAIVSKAGMLLAVGLLVATLWWRRPPRRAGGAVAPVVLSGALIDFHRIAQRWGEIPRLLHEDNARLLAWRASCHMLPDAGLWGIGPGNFALAFPHYTAGYPEAVAGWWEYAHQDYLQVAIEWGWMGALAWGVVVFGGLFRRSTAFRDRRDRLVHDAARLGLASVLLHATFDFPLQIPAIQLAAVAWLAILWRRERSEVEA